MGMKKVNMNEDCKVRLTKYGISVLEGHYKKYAHIAVISENIKSYHKPDEDGVMTFQLWELMQIFGRSIHMGMSEVPFEGNVIMVE